MTQLTGEINKEVWTHLYLYIFLPFYISAEDERRDALATVLVLSHFTPP